MELWKAKHRAQQELRDFGLADKYPLYFTLRGNTNGHCGWKPKKYIAFNPQYIKLNPEELVVDTILHEIAHALDVEHRGFSAHDANWRRWCQVTGANPKRIKVGAVARPKWFTTCGCCGQIILTFFRKPQKDRSGHYHTQCGPESTGMLKLQRNWGNLAMQQGPDGIYKVVEV